MRRRRVRRLPARARGHHPASGASTLVRADDAREPGPPAATARHPRDSGPTAAARCSAGRSWPLLTRCSSAWTCPGGPANAMRPQARRLSSGFSRRTSGSSVSGKTRAPRRPSPKSARSCASARSTSCSSTATIDTPPCAPTTNGTERWLAGAGSIALHDIVSDRSRPSSEVHRFWAELGEAAQTESILDVDSRDGSGMGIGLIWV